MTTPAQGNFSGPSGKAEAGFEASGLSADEADRLASSFKPSWEFDEAPFTQASALRANDIDALEAGGVNSDVRGYSGAPDSERAQVVAAHAPPQRMETHEPEVSVIIDRSITAAEMEQRAPAPQAHPPAAMPSPFGAPAVAAAQPAYPRVVAPVARSRMNADESLELPASLKKSNKGLFIGLGAAALAAVLVFAVRAMTSGASEEANPAATATAAAAATVAAAPPRAAIPPPPAANPAIPAPPPATAAPAPPTPAVASTPAVAASPRARTFVQDTPKPAPRAAPPHHAAPRPPPAPKQQSGGGIVRDNPF